jgi:hypothetical protein
MSMDQLGERREGVRSLEGGGTMEVKKLTDHPVDDDACYGEVAEGLRP